MTFLFSCLFCFLQSIREAKYTESLDGDFKKYLSSENKAATSEEKMKRKADSLVQNEDQKKIKIKDMTSQQRREYEQKLKQDRREQNNKLAYLKKSAEQKQKHRDKMQADSKLRVQAFVVTNEAERVDDEDEDEDADEGEENALFTLDILKYYIIEVDEKRLAKNLVHEGNVRQDSADTVMEEAPWPW